MIIALYILFEIVAFLAFLIGYTNFLKLDEESRMLILISSVILFLLTTYSSFKIDEDYCAIPNNNTTFVCTTQSTYDLSLMGINLMFLIFSVLATVLNWIKLLTRGK